MAVHYSRPCVQVDAATRPTNGLRHDRVLARRDIAAQAFSDICSESWVGCTTRVCVPDMRRRYERMRHLADAALACGAPVDNAVLPLSHGPFTLPWSVLEH